jgi:phospholipid/cholesterol/gamma-HCH transport system substrate-binding protein
MRRPSFISWEQLRVVVIIIIAVVLLGFAMLALGRSANLFSRRYELIGFLSDANGLRPGGPVMVAGKLAGTIKTIEFLPLDADTGRNLVIRMSIDTKVREQVRRDSKGSIRTLGLLGDKTVNIVPGSPSEVPLENGDTIRLMPSLDYEALLSKAAGAMDDVVGLTKDLRVVVSGLAKGQGTIGQMLTNPALYNQLNATLSRTNAMLARVGSSKGTLTKLLDDPALYDQMVKSIGTLDTLVLALSNKNGTLGKLAYDPALYNNLDSLTKRFVTIAGNADSLLTMISSGNGTATKLLRDQELYNNLLKLTTDISAMMADIRADPKRYMRGVISIKFF